MPSLTTSSIFILHLHFLREGLWVVVEVRNRVHRQEGVMEPKLLKDRGLGLAVARQLTPIASLKLRRERIAERMKALQELVPNANKTHKASMLDEIIDYVKFLQLQVKVLSMSRLGGASAVAPPVTDMNSEGVGRSHVSNAGNQTAPTNDGMTVTEHQVAKLMEEDMGSAMQYLQGKGLCLMPISLASAISPTPTSRARPPGRPHIDNNSNNHNHYNFNNDNDNNHHHPLYPAMLASNGEGDPTTDSSIQDPSTS